VKQEYVKERNSGCNLAETNGETFETVEVDYNKCDPGNGMYARTLLDLGYISAS
jgi:hypothetical protein